MNRFNFNLSRIARCIVFLVSIGGISCATGLFSTSKLPQALPEKTVMSYSEHGGMTPAWLKIEIKDNKLFIKEKKPSDVDETLSFCELKEQEVADIYKSYFEAKFDLIENETPGPTVYDAGSSGLRISTGNISHNISNGPNAPLSSANQARFSKVRDSFLVLVKAKRSSLKPQYPTSE